MKAAVIKKAHSIEYSEVPKPKPSDNEVLVKVESSGICGTDVHIFDGEYLAEFPLVPGHEFSGTVVETGKNVQRIQVGCRVAIEPNIACDNCPSCLENRQNFCENWTGIGVTRNGGMAEFVAVPEKAVFDVGDMDFDTAAFVEPLSCVLHGAERADISSGDRVLIMGAGPIGLLQTQVIRHCGAAFIDQVEKNASRLKCAETLGVRRVYSSLNNVETDFYDVVVDATGATQLMERAMDYVRPGGTVMLFGVPPMQAKINLSAFNIFRKGLHILSAYTSRRNSLQALRLLHSGAIDVKSLVTHRLGLDEFADGIRRIKSGSEPVLKILVKPSGGTNETI